MGYCSFIFICSKKKSKTKKILSMKSILMHRPDFKMHKNFIFTIICKQFE